MASVGSHRGWLRLRGPESTRSGNQHVLKKQFKWMRSTAYLLPRGASPERPIVIAGSSDVSNQTVVIFRDPGDRGAPCGSRSDRPLFFTLHRTIQMPRGRTPRSRSDRTAIAARSSRDRGAFDAKSTPWSSDKFSRGSAARSTPNRRTIRPRLWSIVVDRGENRGHEEAESVAKLRPVHGQSRRCDVAPRNRSHYLPNRLHDRLHCHDLRANFAL